MATIGQAELDILIVIYRLRGGDPGQVDLEAIMGQSRYAWPIGEILQSLKTLGFVDLPSQEKIVLTAAGAAYASDRLDKGSTV